MLACGALSLATANLGADPQRPQKLLVSGSRHNSPDIADEHHGDGERYTCGPEEVPDPAETWHYPEHLINDGT